MERRKKKGREERKEGNLGRKEEGRGGRGRRRKTRPLSCACKAILAGEVISASCCMKTILKGKSVAQCKEH